MIKITEYGEKYGKKEYITYDVGEITRLDCWFPRGQGEGELFIFQDSYGESFRSCTKPSFVRLYSLARGEALRNELLSEDYQITRNSRLWCGDPRVIWCYIVSLWIIQNGYGQWKKITEKATSQYLNDNFPTYREASEWVVKNGFVLKPPKVEDRDNKYTRDYGALKYPPKIDWSIFPDKKDD